MRGVGDHRLGERGQFGVELGVVDPEVVQLGQRVLGFVLLVQAALHHLVGTVDRAPGGRVDDLLLGALVHREQPDQVLEQLPLLRPARGRHLVEQGLDLVVLLQQQRHHILLRDVRHVRHLRARVRSPLSFPQSGGSCTRGVVWAFLAGAARGDLV